MFGTALVIGPKLGDYYVPRPPRGVDYLTLGSNARARGCLRLRAGASGETAAEAAELAGAPDLILAHVRALAPRLAGGVDRARKADVENADELAALVVPAHVFTDGKWRQPPAEVLTDAQLEAWLAQVEQYVRAAPADAWLAVYHVHA